FERLQTGSILCQLATVIYDLVQKQKVRSLIPAPPPFRVNAQAGSFLARDNAANFISWSRLLGVDESCLFESEGLVLQKQPRSVILCLLDVARKAARFGVIPPDLVRMEQEIEKEEMTSSTISVDLKKRAKVLKLDDAVHMVVDGRPFDGQVDMERVGEGRYRIGGKIVFIRMLRGKHVMVRVGGGWDTLEHYIITHDVIR
uniref:GAR domain-containing protein n=1 Tax=Ciona savignyi TaxID=51511 RepID=H2YX54_CIOSA